MIIKILALTCCLFPAVLLQAQRERNIIYMIDASSSMGKSENLWNNTRIWLENDIQTLHEGQVTIIPFQEETCTPITFNATEFTDNQADIVATKIDNEVKRLMREKAKANLYNALKDAVKHIDNKKDNFIYLISNSAGDKQDREAVNRFIRNWCKIKPANVYVFYIMLTRNAYDKTLVDALKLCPDFFLIDAKGHKMKPICAFMPQELVVNLQDMQDERLDLWPFGVMSEQQIHCCYDGSFSLSAKTKDPHFLIQNRIQVTNSYGNINIMPKSPKTIEDTLSGQNEYFFDIQLKSENHEVWIVTKKLRVRVVNKPERILYLPLAWNSELQAQHYPKFLFWKANRPDTLHIYLEDFMNKEARLNNSTALFLLSFADIQDADFQLFLNGNERIDKTFTLDSNTLRSRLDIVFSENVRTGSHQLEMRCLSSERLDRINALEPEKLYQSQLIEHQHKHNPLAYLLIISCLLAISIPPSICLISQKSSK